ncbi:MAG: hypothetical protein ABSD31_00725 [Candidatus Binataceae bacterium]|jgi:hypothetical protein
MTTAINPAVFSQQIFATPARSQTDKNGAVQGFAEIFASMLATELRKGGMGSSSGPMGISGSGATGDVYGAFFDQAIGKVLARSPAMKPLTDVISRQLAGSNSRKSSSAANALAALSQAGRTLVQPASYAPAASPNLSTSAVSNGSAGSTAADSRGPLLLPPRPATFGPILPPPATLTEG